MCWEMPTEQEQNNDTRRERHTASAEEHPLQSNIQETHPAEPVPHAACLFFKDSWPPAYQCTGHP